MFNLIIGAVAPLVSSFVDDVLGWFGGSAWLDGLFDSFDVSAAVSDVVSGAAISAATGNSWLDGALAGGLSSLTGTVGGSLGLSPEITNALRGGVLGSGSTGWSMEGALGGAASGYLGGFRDSTLTPGSGLLSGAPDGLGTIPDSNASQLQAAAAGDPGFTARSSNVFNAQDSYLLDGAAPAAPPQDPNAFNLTSNQGLTGGAPTPPLGGLSGLLSGTGGAQLAFGALSGIGQGAAGQATADASERNSERQIQAAREARQDEYPNQIDQEERAAQYRRDRLMMLNPNSYGRRA